MARGFDIDVAARELARRDRALAKRMRQIGDVAPRTRWRQSFDTVDALARSIMYQQLSGKAAATIVGRVEAALGGSRIDPAAVMATDDATLRGCGLSQNKLLALRDLSRRWLDGELPSPRQMGRMDNEAIVTALTAVRGIGRWTVEMLLIFRLGRPDVLPLDDLGLRRGAQLLDGLESMPDAKQLAARGEPWGPWRSLASLYLWRIADQ